MNASKFWLVWRNGSIQSRVKHPTHALAEQEAIRLANLNPGEEFYVMQAVTVVCRTSPVQVIALT